MRPYLVSSLVLASLSFLSLCARADAVQVAVASNFTAPMRLIAADFEKDSGHKVTLSFGTVGKFYAQMKNGAPFEVLVSADKETPDRLVAEGLALGATQHTYAIGKLVLWSAQPGYVNDNGDVLKKGDFRHLAMANPKLAVYGAAAQETLKRLGLLDALQARLVVAENITQAYQFVATGNAALGFVALSQVVGKQGGIDRGSAWMVPPELYPPIRQDAVVLAPGKDKAAALALVNYLKGSKAKAVIRSFGYDL
jgi:molybdate transport system substrate-binding protein